MSGPHSAFFYGTLMAPEVFYTVCYQSHRPPAAIRELHKFRPAILHDFCRHRVKYADYPGIVPEAGQSVRGVLATGLTDANVGKLDFFEGTEYRKEVVRVKLLAKPEGDASADLIEGGEEGEAVVYVYKDKANLEEGEWDIEHFRKEKMKKWVREDFMFEECLGEPATFEGNMTESDLRSRTAT